MWWGTAGEAPGQVKAGCEGLTWFGCRLGRGFDPSRSSSGACKEISQVVLFPSYCISSLGVEGSFGLEAKLLTKQAGEASLLGTRSFDSVIG